MIAHLRHKQTTMIMRWLMAALVMLFLFTGIDAQAQGTRATATIGPETDRVPPPGDDDPPPPPFNAAMPISQSVPATMTAGGVYTVTINMKNTGNTTWTSGTAYSLGSRNPFDNTTWGGGRVALPYDIPPDGFAQFTFQVTAPPAPGSYNFQWGMVQDGVEWFGSPSSNLVINVVAPARVNGAAIIGQNVPAQMVSGQSYPVTMVMQNTGNTTWTSADQYSFGIPTTNGVQLWNSGRVPLPGAIPPGGQATFNFNVTAPAPGNYSFFGLMVQDGVEFFGQGSNITVSVSAPPTNGAGFVSQSVPANMVPGQMYNVSVTMQNTGTTSWTASENYRLGSSNPLGNGTWTTTRVELPSAVGPGQTATFNFQVVAPSTAGNYNFEWRMLREWVEWFGTPSANVQVSVSAPIYNNAQFVSQSVPSTMLPGQPYTVTVVMLNNGTRTWTAHGDTGLASANPLANNTWNAVRIDQPTTTAPGQTASYTFQVTAPASPGTYNFQWKMVQDQIEWFGAATPNLAIAVATQGDTVTYIHTDALGSPVARSDSAGNKISRTQYEPYGRTASGVTPTIGFTGHVNDADTGMVYMQQRYYDPIAGRFISTDPVLTNTNTGGAFNRYLYGNGNPYKYVDPDGRFAVFIHWGITFAAPLHSGNSLAESITYANRAWKADTEAGSQGFSPDAVARHAMRNDFQTVDEARINNAHFVARAIAGGDLGLASHATQDRYADAHDSFAVWKGFKDLGVIGTLKHILSDSFPTPSRVAEAFKATVNIFETSKNSEKSENEIFSPANVEQHNTGNNFSPAGCMAEGGDCWH